MLYFLHFTDLIHIYLFENMTFILFKIFTNNYHYNGNHQSITSGQVHKYMLYCKFLYVLLIQPKTFRNYKTLEITTQYNFNALKFIY